MITSLVGTLVVNYRVARFGKALRNGFFRLSSCPSLPVTQKKACLRAERKKKSMKKEKRIFWVGQIGGGVVSDVDDKSGATDGGREYTLVTAVINGVRVTAFAGVGAALREMEGKSIKQMLLAYVENDGYFGFDLLAICDE